MYQSSAHLALDILQSYEYLPFNQVLSICSEVHKATTSLHNAFSVPPEILQPKP